ncbi:hypothetical protein QE436_004486 [Pantoea anthophila]|nr:hypothetical protein [Pantoea anthophila]
MHISLCIFIGNKDNAVLCFCIPKRRNNNRTFKKLTLTKLIWIIYNRLSPSLNSSLTQIIKSDFTFWQDNDGEGHTR